MSWQLAADELTAGCTRHMDECIRIFIRGCLQTLSKDSCNSSVVPKKYLFDKQIGSWSVHTSVTLELASGGLLAQGQPLCLPKQL